MYWTAWREKMQWWMWLEYSKCQSSFHAFSFAFIKLHIHYLHLQNTFATHLLPLCAACNNTPKGFVFSWIYSHTITANNRVFAERHPPGQDLSRVISSSSGPGPGGGLRIGGGYCSHKASIWRRTPPPHCKTHHLHRRKREKAREGSSPEMQLSRVTDSLTLSQWEGEETPFLPPLN